MSNITTLKRIRNETNKLQSSAKEYGKMFVIRMKDDMDDNMFQWRATIYGPPNTFYKSYEFDIDLSLPENYPKSPIAVKFVTPIQHVNVNNTGDVCLNILKDGWKSYMDISLVLLSLIDLLGTPNLEDPLNSDLAQLYRENKEKYKLTIECSCEKYARKRIL
jgi:ubiquitin-protein ligase